MRDANYRIDIDGVSVSPHHFIGGERVASPNTFETRCPMEWERKLADVARGDAAIAERAVSAAVEGFRAWSAMPIAERCAVLYRLADLIDAHAAEIATVECLDMAMLKARLMALKKCVLTGFPAR